MAGKASRPEEGIWVAGVEAGSNGVSGMSHHIPNRAVHLHNEGVRSRLDQR